MDLLAELGGLWGGLHFFFGLVMIVNNRMSYMNSVLGELFMEKNIKNPSKYRRNSVILMSDISASPSSLKFTNEKEKLHYA